MLPLIRWVGSKRRYAKTIAYYFPDNLTSYGEPFVGSGAVMLELMGQGKIVPGAQVYINDLPPVTDFWDTLINHPDDLIQTYELLRANKPEDAYEIAKDCIESSSRLRAAGFLYLNQTSFNGLFRRNRSGKFNVPRDPKRVPPDLAARIRALHEFLARYQVFVGEVPYDLQAYYFDPPYDGKTFTAYGAHPVGSLEQRAIADHCRQLVARGSHVVASNADTPRVRELYEGFDFHSLMRKNTVSAKASTRNEMKPELIMVSK